MNLNTELYNLKDSEDETLKYFFISEGKEVIVKAIEYQYIQIYKEYKMYNLAFGNYDVENDEIIDNVVSNNNDGRKVFNTVLSTIPTFFGNYSDGMLMVQGSDSSNDFIANCYEKCEKKCKEGKCRKFNQRLRIYTNYINANYDDLIKDYNFYGGILSNGKIYLKEYKIIDRDNYIGVFVTKKSQNNE